MNVKKIALVSLASVATLAMSVSFAGGPAACAPAAQTSGVYVGLDFGYNSNNSLKVETGNTSADTSGWTLSGLVGYQFNNSWSVQAGYIWNQDLDYKIGSQKYHAESYNYYIAAKGSVPLMDQFSGYMLVGPAYSHGKVKHSNETRKYWSPMGALGVSYAMDDSLSFNLQYMFIAGPTSSKTSTANERSSQRITIGANYLFAM